jgi:hypothetical protein
MEGVKGRSGVESEGPCHQTGPEDSGSETKDVENGGATCVKSCAQAPSSGGGADVYRSGVWCMPMSVLAKVGVVSGVCRCWTFLTTAYWGTGWSQVKLAALLLFAFALSCCDCDCGFS